MESRSPFSVVNRGERLLDVKLMDSVRVRSQKEYVEYVRIIH